MIAFHVVKGPLTVLPAAGARVRLNTAQAWRWRHRIVAPTAIEDGGAFGLKGPIRFQSGETFGYAGPDWRRVFQAAVPASEAVREIVAARPGTPGKTAKPAKTAKPGRRGFLAR